MQEGIIMDSNYKWKLYNKALLPISAPHESAATDELDRSEIWSKAYWGEKPLLARWTSCYDCGYETNWWWVIKDSPFDIETIKSKRRYEIKKGLKNFEVRIINPTQYLDDLFKVQVAALSAYPEKYRPKTNFGSFQKSVEENWINKKVYGAFSAETSELCGYAVLSVFDNYVGFKLLKVKPESEKFAINAAIVYCIVRDYNEKLSKSFYIADGERSVQHETAFQDYLEKYFEFRKAYCKLNIKYARGLYLIVCFLYPLRNFLKKHDCRFLHKINGVLFMENIRRESNKD